MRREEHLDEVCQLMLCSCLCAVHVAATVLLSSLGSACRREQLLLILSVREHRFVFAGFSPLSFGTLSENIIAFFSHQHDQVTSQFLHPSALSSTNKLPGLLLLQARTSPPMLPAVDFWNFPAMSAQPLSFESSCVSDRQVCSCVNGKQSFIKRVQSARWQLHVVRGHRGRSRGAKPAVCLTAPSAEPGAAVGPISVW